VELALNGGTPVRTRPWLDNFTTGEDEKRAALRVLDSGYLSLFEGSYMPDSPFAFLGGPEVQALESEWSAFYGVEHAITVNSATSGLFAAVGALGLGYGDEVIVSPYTMSACALAPLIYGAIPVFADVDPLSGSLDVASIEERIGPHTRGILVVHQFGFPADMDRIMALARKHDLRVIEDCAQAHGARYKGVPVGTIGDIGVFSLNVNKTIQVGEGGVCVTHDSDLAYRMQLIRNHGEAVVGPARYENITNMAGFNYRMTELGAALARVQLERLPQLTEKRLALVAHLESGLADVTTLRPLPGRANEVDSLSTYYVVPFTFTAGESRVGRDDIVKALRAEGVAMGAGYVRPLYLQPLYQRQELFKSGYPFSAPANAHLRRNYEPGTCPVAERLHFKELLVNEHIRPPHDLSDVDDVVEAVLRVVGG
jgi:dTDP-4-amino-4,6-dideoxygalactose transaminase